MKRILVICSFVLASLTAQAQGPQGAQQALEMLKNVEVVKLTDSDITNFVAAGKEFDESDIDIDGFDEDRVPSYAEMIESVEANGAAMKILKRHGFSAESFASVSMNIMIALGASEMKGHEAEIAQSLAQIEEMKAQIPPATYEMLRDQIAGAQQIFAKAPPENIVLVEKHRAAIDSVGDE